MSRPTPYKGPKVGQEAYDAATGRVGVLQDVCHVDDLIFDHRMSGPRVAFLRPAEGGREWMTDARNVRFPEGAEKYSDVCGEPRWE
ncbi:hypothetical protein SBI_06315 [Streptomyces bingchenggensis BCW-1]|uniref:Uncharacterized protein n=1 Tax=Streptomyces bingchenggensis (strain BCW-1) TaxID=749414 RepID=D7BSB7_STRBB|nr:MULTISPECIES: hypothetical protein [Streptomyces]ADI09435.1 hypothetical protein SBI_06315 [Streptomyces bingchenggensis BCW-1]